MRLSFLGAAREVTGSCYYLETTNHKILIDCGMEQGPDIYENQELSIPAGEVDTVILTHSHIDHSGLLPLLYRNGFRGKIYMTKASKDLCHIMLLDSAHIQKLEAEWRNRTVNKNSSTYYAPMYDEKDVLGVETLFVECNYEEPIELSSEISVTFYDAGHLLGSASVEISVLEGKDTKIIVFSGDIGNKNKPILKNPTLLEKADYVVMESTYGNQRHRDTNNYVEQLVAILFRAFSRGGSVIIPSFAVGRMQELLYFLRMVKMDKRLHYYRNFKVFVDSPLAIEATKVFKKNYIDYFDEKTRNLIEMGINPLEFGNLNMSLSTEDSKNIFLVPGPKVIIAASGMCEAGRIRHHLRQYLPDYKNIVVFVGFQINGTLGSAILDGAKKVKIFNEEISINAEIIQMKGTSSHADVDDLLEWANSFCPMPRRIFVTHGNEQVSEDFANTLSIFQGQTVTVPYNGAIWDLTNNSCIYEGNKEAKRRTDPKNRYIIKINDAYGNLVEALERLRESVRQNEGLENRELRKFTEEIVTLAKKWNREEN